MKKLTEAQEKRLDEGILDWLWKRSMAGKTDGLIKMFDDDPEVKRAIMQHDKALGDLKNTIKKSKTVRSKLLAKYGLKKV